MTEAVHRATLNEIFHGPLVQLALTHSLQEILQRTEWSALIALSNHIANQTMAYIFDGTKTKSNGIPLYGKGVIGMVDIRGQNRDTKLFTLGNVPGDLSGRVQHRGHQRRHILPGIVALEICCLVSNHGVANRMGLVKGIVGKVHNLVIDRLCYLLRDTVTDTAGNPLLRVAVDEDLTLRLDDLHLLFGDCPADIIRLSHGVATQRAENLNHLLLVDDTAVGDLQNRLQKGGFIGHILGIQLVGNESGDRIHWTGTVQCHNSGKVFNG